MFNQIKSILWPIITIGISFLLFPTLAEIIFKNSQQRNTILSFLANFSTLLQFLGIFLTAIPSIILIILNYKENKANAVLIKASNSDDLWNEDSLKYQTRFIFYKVQNAFEDNDITGLDGYATEEFISWFKNIIKEKKSDASNTINVIGTKIVCSRDFVNNQNDSFIGYIEGNNTGAEDKDGCLINEFSEIYHFVRYQNDWLLNKVSSSSIWNLLLVESKYEG